MNALALTPTWGIAVCESEGRLPMHAVLIVLMSALAHASATANPPDAEAVSEQDAIELADKTVLESAMKRSDEGASQLELNRLPLPALVYFHTIEQALNFRSAWPARSVASSDREKAIQTVQFFASDGAHLYYSEWACETGRETDVATEFVALLPKVVTVYPERLLLKRFAQERERMGYGSARRCRLEELNDRRRYYEKVRAEMRVLSSDADGTGPS